MADHTPTETTLTIEGLGYGGEGFCHSDKGFVSVHHTLPGDVVRVRLGEFRRGRAWAEVLEWVDRSARYVDPTCPLYAHCTGCSLRHVSVADESGWKIDELRKILAKTAPALSWDGPVQWLGDNQRLGHRTRGRFRAVWRGGRLHLGLRATTLEGAVVDVRGCPAQAEPYGRLVDQLTRTIERHGWADLDSVEVRLPQPVDRPGALVLLDGPEPSPALRSELMDTARLVGASIGRRVGKDFECWHGTPYLPVLHPCPGFPDVAGLSVAVPWSSWSHATPSPAEAVANWVAGQIGPEHTRVLDLCAGIGTITSALLSPGRKILAVDRDYLGLRALQAAATEAGVDGLTTRAGKVETILPRLVNELAPGERPAAAVVNPMRQPLGECLSSLVDLGVERVVYCGPSAVPAVKDLARLGASGFELDELAVANLHPATGQFMVVASLRAPAPRSDRVRATPY